MRSFMGSILNDDYRLGKELKEDIEITDKPLCVLLYGKIIVENQLSERVIRPMGRKDYQLLYIKHGEFEFRKNRDKKIYGKNTLFLFSPNYPQDWLPLSDKQRCTQLFIHFSGYSAKEELDKLGIHEGLIPLNEKFTVFEDIINQMEAKKGSIYHQDFCNILLKELFLHIADNQPKLNTNTVGFKFVLKLMKENCDKNLPLSFYASKLDFSEIYFIKFFRQAMGITPHKYLNNLKLEKAADLLAYSDYSIRIIAEKLGFSNQHYFSTSFRNKYKLSPTEFRNTNNKSIKNDY